jgi:hypothetical protein
MAIDGRRLWLGTTNGGLSLCILIEPERAGCLLRARTGIIVVERAAICVVGS